MLQCIGFASWRDRERERGRERTKNRRSEETRELRAAELRQDRFVQVYGCMIGWQSVSLHLFSPRLLLIFSHTRVQMTPSVIRASVHTEVIYVFNNICKVKP